MRAPHVPLLALLLLAAGAHAQTSYPDLGGWAYSQTALLGSTTFFVNYDTGGYPPYANNEKTYRLGQTAQAVTLSAQVAFSRGFTTGDVWQLFINNQLVWSVVPWAAAGTCPNGWTIVGTAPADRVSKRKQNQKRRKGTQTRRRRGGRRGRRRN